MGTTTHTVKVRASGPDYRFVNVEIDGRQAPGVVEARFRAATGQFNQVELGIMAPEAELEVDVAASMMRITLGGKRYRLVAEEP